MKYAIVIERGSNSWGAYVPDLPGCVAVGNSRQEVLTLIREAIKLHLDELRKKGAEIPVPLSEARNVEIQGCL